MPWARKGIPRTEEDKRAISKGTKVAMTPEVCKKIVLNRNFGEEVKEKIRQAHLKPISEELGNQIVELYTGGASQSMVASQLNVSRCIVLNALESRSIVLRNLSEAHKLAYKLGRSGTLHNGSQEPGSKNIHWRGGTSFEPYTVDFYEKREKIMDRDNHQCQICGVPRSEYQFCLSVHHIDYNKKNDADDNLISLCHDCHSRTSHNREYWQTYLSNPIERRQLNAVSS